MELSFYKLRVCGSDVILVDDLEGGGADRDWEAVARAMLPRRRGAGADRLAVLSRAETDIWIRFFSREGEGGCRADAALCAARYLLDSGRSGAVSVALRAPADPGAAPGADPAASGGTIAVDVLDSAFLGLSMGPPRGLPDGAVLGPAEAAARMSTVEAGGGRFQVLPLRAGLPGSDAAAVFAEGGAARARARIAPSPGGGASAVVVRVVSRGELRAGAAAGPGLDSCAAAGIALAAAAAAGLSDREALVRLGRGGVWAEWTETGALYAVARPEYVYRGEFHLDAAIPGSSRP